MTMNPIQFELGVNEVYLYPPNEPNTYHKWVAPPPPNAPKHSAELFGRNDLKQGKVKYE